jgi:co-chaperonin GroES (HSP10)
MMNWPEKYRLVGDSLIANIALPENTPSGLSILERDPRRQAQKPDCFIGDVTETGSQCKLVRKGDRVVFTRWMYSQSDVDDERICLREVDLVIVNEKCVNGYIAVQVYEPFKKTDLVLIENEREIPKNYWGRIVDKDPYSKNKETTSLNKGDIILFQHMEDYQYRVGKHMIVFKDFKDVVIAKMEAASIPVMEVINA